MKLKDLLEGINVLECTADLDLDIANIVRDTRKDIPAGSLFVAVSGFAFDGNRYIPMAMEKGAAAVITAKKPDMEVPYILVDSDRKALAMLGVNFYGHPAEKMTMIGITGTNGKTSVTLLLKHLLEKTVGAKVGLVGTMGNMIGDTELPTERTTPESFELQALFAQMVEAGCTHCVMEVSSHALTLDRVGGVHYDVAAFTNLTEDHLDFHKTMEAYCDAKAELFRRCDRAVLNRDDMWFDRMVSGAACDVLTTSVKEKAGLTAEDLEKPAAEELDDDDLDTVAGGSDVSCACAMGGGGTKDSNDKTCACVLAGVGYDDTKGERCLCGFAGYGYDT